MPFFTSSSFSFDQGRPIFRITEQRDFASPIKYDFQDSYVFLFCVEEVIYRPNKLLVGLANIFLMVPITHCLKLCYW